MQFINYYAENLKTVFQDKSIFTPVHFQNCVGIVFYFNLVIFKKSNLIF